jgi:hypothetical protein
MKLTAECATRAVNRLALMAFFPGDPEVRAALVDIVMEMCETRDQLDWLVARALKLYAKWPGIAELRALYCSRWKPLDGVEVYSSIYLDGIPSERPAPPPPPRVPRSPKPGDITRDPELDQAVRNLGEQKRLPTSRASGKPRAQK